MSIADKLQEIAKTQKSIYDAGYNKGVDYGMSQSSDSWWNTFWDEYQIGGTRSQWNNAFYQAGWNDKNYNPKYPITTIYYASSMFNTNGITDTKIPLDFSKVKMQPSAMFQNSNKLKTIRTLTVAQSNTYSGWFSGCGALENITFSGEIGNNISFADSPNLSSESVTSIIDALVTVTEARTLTLNASVSLTDEQKSIIEEKGWDLVQ